MLGVEVKDIDVARESQRGFLASVHPHFCTFNTCSMAVFFWRGLGVMGEGGEALRGVEVRVGGSSARRIPVQYCCCRAVLQL